MQTLIGYWDKKRILRSLPEFWFLAILLLGWVEFVRTLFTETWNVVYIIPVILLVILTVSLVRQLLYQKIVASIVMGIVFLVVCLYFSLALYSELAKFVGLTDSKAVEMMLGGGITVGGSMIMSLLMIIRSLLKIREAS